VSDRERNITIRDIYDRQCNKEILATTALYGPWTREGEFDWPSYDRLVEKVAPDRVQFSTGNDWFIALARYGKNIRRHGYLLGASQISPVLFKMWRDDVRQGKACSLALEQDLQAAAKDFWTPGNVGIYRHYLAIFLTMTGLIDCSVPHPQCEARYRVNPPDYFTPLKHALRLGLVDHSGAVSIVRHVIPGCDNWSRNRIEERIRWMS
jgi:hypothetical protein